MWDNPFIAGNPNRISVWMWILDNVEWEEGTKVKFKGETIELKKGQCTCGIYMIEKQTGVKAKTVHRVLNCLRNEKQIEKDTDMNCSLITVINWDQYQLNEKDSENEMRNKRETSEKPVRTKKEVKNNKKERKLIIYRPETKTLYEWIDRRCNEIGIENKTKEKALDVYVNRYLGKVQFRPELDHYLAWMLDNDKRVLRSSAVGNCLKRKFDRNKAEEIKTLEWRQAQNDPFVRAKIQKMPKEDRPSPSEMKKEDFSIPQDVKDRLGIPKLI